MIAARISDKRQINLMWCFESDPMTSRVAPAQQRAVPVPAKGGDSGYRSDGDIPDRDKYILTPERLKEIRSEKMYPFYDRDEMGGTGDFVKELNDNSAKVQKQLNFRMAFFGFGFNYTWVRFIFFYFFCHQRYYYCYY